MKYYKGTASVIIAVAEDGTRVQFPATALRNFVTADGVSGSFLLRTDNNNKMIELVRI